MSKDTITTSTEPQPPSPNGSGPAEAPPAYDPFNPEGLHANVVANIDVEHVLTTVPVRKPKRNEWFRVHRGDGYTVDTFIFERDDGMDKESYLVTPNVQHLVSSELRLVRLFTAITRTGTVFLWPIKLSDGGNDRLRRMTNSALQGAEQGKDLWTKLAWDRNLGAYEMYRAKGDLGEPQWPDKSFRDLLEIAFRDNLIDRGDHPVIRELAGEL